MSLFPFITGRMMINHQPYRKLAELSREIDADVSINDEGVLTRLEAIRENYGIKYAKRIRKPRILYSIMVNK